MNQEKSNFIVGLSVGIAVVSLGAMIMMSKGQVTNTDNNTTDNQPTEANNNNNANNNQPSAPTPTQPQAVDIKTKDTDWYRGNKDAKVTIIEFSDIQCPFCTRHHNTMKQLLEEYPQDVKWVFKHFPLDSIHPQARKAAEASECAGDQGKFWEYLDHLFDNQNQLGSSFYISAAEELGLDKDKMKSCIDTGKFKKRVNDNYQEGLKYGVRGTPGNFINGISSPGAIPFSQLEAMVLSEK